MKRGFEPWADQLVAIFATAGGGNKLENAWSSRVSRRRSSVGNMAPNSALLTDTYTSPLRAHGGAAKRER
jgi:hypothetical protein